MVGRVHLLWVVAAAFEVPNFVVTEVSNHLKCAWIAAEEMFSYIGTIIGFKGLVVAVQSVHHDFAQRAVFVACQEGIPLTAPQEFDHVPARTSEFAFEFLHDLAVTAHRTVQALQVAVHHEDQVV